MHWAWAVVVLMVALSILHANYWVAQFMHNELDRRKLVPLDEADLLGLSHMDTDISGIVDEVPDDVWDEMDEVLDDEEEE